MNRRTRTTHGYTLLELLVVIVIAALLVGIAIPAFRGILASSRRSLAESKLQQALYAARDAATSSIGGGDAAAVFFFEPGQGIRVLTCIEVGSLEDSIRGQGDIAPGGNAGDDARRIDRDVFVPLSGFEPVQLPPGIGVRGFALGPQFLEITNWYEALEDRRRPPLEPGYWVFPETAFYDENELDAGDVRQTFMVRFTAGDGTLSRELRQALVIAPSTGNDPQIQVEGISDTDDLELWARRFLSRAGADPSPVVGNQSVHSVLAGPVTELALYEERDLVQALGGRGLNQATGTVYKSAAEIRQDSRVDGVAPTIDSRVFSPDDETPPLGRPRVFARNSSRWIEGREILPGNRPQIDSTARVFAINAFFGDLVEITR